MLGVHRAIMTRAETQHQLGNTLRRQGRAAEALAHLETAARLESSNPTILLNLGVTHLDLNQPACAAEVFSRAVSLVPAMPEARNILGCALLGEGRIGDARTHLEEALRLRPNYPAAHDNLGRACRAQGRITEALAHFQSALAGNPSPGTHANYLLAGNYADDLAPAELVDRHRRWDELHARRHRPRRRPPLPPLHRRRVRIGYVSPDFRQHSVAFFFAPVLAAHDRAQFEVFCYDNGVAADTVTARLRGQAEHWRGIAALDDEAAAALVRQDGIDILVDLAGHTARNRLLVFARQPAPVQVTWLGYPNTTGMTAMDYRITDGVCLPAEEDSKELGGGQSVPLRTEAAGLDARVSGSDSRHGPEALVRLPEVFCCYQPPPDCPPVRALPKAGGRPFTFCSFNNLAKVSPGTVAVWAAILDRHPGSRLLLKSPGAGDPETQAAVRARFAGRDIAPERLHFNGEPLPMRRHLELYQECDIALDPFPYNGTTTTCEALLMGVPVITLAGRSHASRVGASFLASLGLPELVASNPAEYAGAAARLAADPARLAALRASLRPRLLDSPLGQADRVTRNLESALLDLCRLPAS